MAMYDYDYYTDSTSYSTGTFSSGTTWASNTTGSIWVVDDAGSRHSFVPDDLADEGFEPIQGDPETAKYLVSYLFKEPIDPVVFVKSKKEAMELVEKLLEDETVDHDSIIVHKISSQFRPKVKKVKKTIEVDEVELEKM